ncbi:lytic transglycosylase domain-containing protein [Acinetobacter radioresistens]|uniref:lytic transglycosylase domain-containing protein n=1 Tax=Acinetobacter radioresistens TaxID=40216 RepID=UPI0021CD415D|nr:lytic transglycosylase domain-containing protein [Acinetobacter radioresistens]MCU4596857.1 lytic transglycosylase domain-containing protein [Acinetobacter radioresistens]
MVKNRSKFNAGKKSAFHFFKIPIFTAIVGVFSVGSYAVPYEDLIHKHSLANGIDPNLTIAVITRESGFKPNARSSKNAQGLMQVIPSTARFMGVNPNSLYDPEQNIIAGTKYLAYLSKMFNGDIAKILAGYNAGHGAVLKYNGIPPYRETQNYVRYVSSRYLSLSNRFVGRGSSEYGYQSVSYNYQVNNLLQQNPMQKMSDTQQQLYSSLNNTTTIFVRNH